MLFTQTTVETILTPLTARWYDFDASWNSLLFTGMVCDTTTIETQEILGRCHRRIPGSYQFFNEETTRQDFINDRPPHRRLWYGLFLTHLYDEVGNVLFVIFLVLARHIPKMKIPLYQFCIVTAIYIAAIAFYQSILGSLFRFLVLVTPSLIFLSKLLNDKLLDGRGQSVLSGASSLGSILGPLASTAAVNTNLLFVPSIMGGLWSVVLFLLIASWDYMYVDQTVEEVEEQAIEEETYFDEKTETIGESASWVEDEKKELLVKKRRRTSSGSATETSHSAERLRETNKSVNF